MHAHTSHATRRLCSAAARPLLALALLAGVHEAAAQKVTPTTAGTGTGTRWTFTMGEATFLAGAKHGGRIHALRLAGSDILHMDTATATNYGSTFWPSPQAVWNWPPPANIDGNGAYTAELVGDTVLTLVGQVDNTTKLRFRKEYWADLSDSTFNMRFTMVNTGAARAWSPWQNSRLDTGGVYFFPAGEGTVTGDLAQFVKDSIGMKWYAHGTATTLSSGTTKFFADGKDGWFAHVTVDRILFLKKFKDAPLSKKAPDPENEIQIYTTNRPINNSDFVEMEVQGSYDSIAQNDSASWDMKWYVRKLPDSITNVSIGNPQLVAFVNQVLTPTSTSLRTPASRDLAAARLAFAAGRVEVTLEQARALTVSLLDARGRLVQSLHSGELSAGSHSFALPGASQGVHWVVLRDANRNVLASRLIPSL
jgi:hypothetical protein